MKIKILFFTLLLLSFTLMMTFYPNQVISSSTTEVLEDKNLEDNDTFSCPTEQEYLQNETTSYNEIVSPEINNIDKSVKIQGNSDIDKKMIIQGDASIDPYILIEPPGKIFDPRMLDLLPSEQQD